MYFIALLLHNAAPTRAFQRPAIPCRHRTSKHTLLRGAQSARCIEGWPDEQTEGWPDDQQKWDDDEECGLDGWDCEAEVAKLFPDHPEWEKNRVERIILVRHGESMGNVDESSYGRVADWRIPLTDKGREQARGAGRTLKELLSAEAPDAAELGQRGLCSDDSDQRRSCYFYVSPYLRTRQTLRGMLDEIDRDQILGIREEPRISEQQFGNYQNPEVVQNSKLERRSFGRFYYRFPDGESGFDVYNRVTSFIATIFRDIEQLHAKGHDRDRLNIVIVTHGLALRLILMRWFQYTIHEFEESINPGNGAVIVLERRTDPENGQQWYELFDEMRMELNLPAYSEQSRFRVGEDLSILEKDWGDAFSDYEDLDYLAK